VQEATPVELYRRPADHGVAAFVGDVVRLAGTVRAGVVRCALGELPAAGAPDDGPVTVLLRPEQITLDAGAAARVPARVVAVEFHGHDAVVRLDVEGVPAVTARCLGHLVPAVGDAVGLAVQGPVIALPVPVSARAQLALRSRTAR
jgi:iron(III) transport system ATP-binding protein